MYKENNTFLETQTKCTTNSANFNKQLRLRNNHFNEGQNTETEAWVQETGE